MLLHLFFLLQSFGHSFKGVIDKGQQNCIADNHTTVESISNRMNE